MKRTWGLACGLNCCVAGGVADLTRLSLPLSCLVSSVLVPPVLVRIRPALVSAALHPLLSSLVFLALLLSLLPFFPFEA